MGLVKELEQKWRGKIIKDSWEGDCSHVVSLRDLMEELSVLSRLTFDGRFMETRTLIGNLVVELGLTDGKGKWKKGIAPADDLPPPNYANDAARLIARGMSKRQAFAEVAVRWSVPAATFSGAMAKVKREWEKSISEKLDTSGGCRNP